MADETSARLGLPLLQPGQAQKEMTHNEAVALLDLLVQPCASALGVDMPPADPAPGDCWIVGAAPVGAWAGMPHCLAGWTGGGWRFAAPREGLSVWIAEDGVFARFSGDAWSSGALTAAQLSIGGVQVIGAQAAAIAAPAGGDTIDAAARATLAAILAALRTHGLIAA